MKRGGLFRLLTVTYKAEINCNSSAISAYACMHYLNGEVVIDGKTRMTQGNVHHADHRSTEHTDDRRSMSQTHRKVDPRIRHEKGNFEPGFRAGQ